VRLSAGNENEQRHLLPLVDELLEIEQPERELEVARVEDVGVLAEAVAVFVVAVEKEDAELRPRFQDLLEDQREAARFADPGRAEEGEMLNDIVPPKHSVLGPGPNS